MPTGGSSSPCTSWPTSTPTRPTGATSRASATCRKAATPWPARSATARRASCTTATSAAWRTSSASLGLVLNCVVLWTTVYLDAAVRQLRAQGYPVRDEDMARLSPFVSRHLGVHGTYSFVLPDLAPGAIRELRDPDAADGRRPLTPGRRRERIGAGQVAGLVTSSISMASTPRASFSGRRCGGCWRAAGRGAGRVDLLRALGVQEFLERAVLGDLFTDVDLPISRVEAKASRGYG